MHQIKTFDSEKELNDWLKDNSKWYEIMDIQFQFASPSYRRYMVWYREINE